jgi:beta-aspartyl-peptidase (threonine type)
MSSTWSIAVHGGAGTIARSAGVDEQQRVRAGIADGISAARRLLETGASAVEAVEAAVRALEDCVEFNAGRGAVYNSAGLHELEAAVMNGADRRCGAVCCVQRVRNPVSAARAVMERSIHVLLSGAGAEEFAVTQGLEQVDPSYFSSELRRRRFEELKGTARSELDHYRKSRGTVGAVARDRAGNIAAATSTGGMTNKLVGRVGDAPIIGAGTYADDRSLAVSCTGIGEEFMRSSAASFLHYALLYGVFTLEEAVSELLSRHVPDDTGGLIAVLSSGRIHMDFNTLGMYRGSQVAGGTPKIAIWRDT